MMIDTTEASSQRLRRDVLAAADHLVSDERASQYGDAAAGFERIARLWNAHFGANFIAADVAAAMILVKVARLGHDHTHIDSWTDIAGYAALGAEVSATEGA